MNATDRAERSTSADPHRSAQEFVDYYIDRHDSPEMVSRFELLKAKILAFLATRPGYSAETVLDIGCGPGTEALIWAAGGYRVSALDINGPVVEHAKEKARDRHLEVDFRLGSATALPWQAASFDLCLLPELLEHVGEWRTVLDEAVRVLRPGGLLYLSTTNALCPRQEEFDLPCYSWYPGWLKRRYERLAVTSRPELVNHATYPAINWFTPYGLSQELRSRGLVSYDRFDLLDVGTDSGAKKIVATLCRSLAPVRFVGHCCTSSTTLFAIKSQA